MVKGFQDEVSWILYFNIEGRIYLTDKCILIDHKYVFPAEMPPEGVPSKYRRVKKYLNLPVQNQFCFDSMTTTKNLNFEGPCGLVLNHKYLSFLLERIPQNLLNFGMTGDGKAPVWIYRGDEPIGMLMPMLVPLPYDTQLIARAEDGDAEAQYCLANYYQAEDGPIPRSTREAHKWLKAAADQNHPRAIFELGLMYIFLEGYGDRETALDHMNKAIELGCRDAIQWRHKLLQNELPEKSRFLELFEKWLDDQDGER